MLWSGPPLAQRPIVPGVNYTFEDASISAASEREIQSDGGFDIGQSAFLADVSAEATLDSAAAVLAAGSPPEAGLDPGSDETRLDLDDPDRSLRAQPPPL